MITKLDILKIRMFGMGLKLICIELLLMLAWSAAAKSWNGPLFVIILITAVMIACCVIDPHKTKILNGWEEIGQSLRAFPVTDEERKTIVSLAKTILRGLVLKTTDAQEMAAKLKEEKDQLEVRYVYGFRGLERSPERESVGKELAILEEKLLRAEKDVVALKTRSAIAWKLFTQSQPQGGIGLSPEVNEEFRDLDEFRGWIREVFQSS